MADGDWHIALHGTGKIHPADADEIQQLLVSFIAVLTNAGHTSITGDIQKTMKG